MQMGRVGGGGIPESVMQTSKLVIPQGNFGN